MGLSLLCGRLYSCQYPPRKQLLYSLVVGPYSFAAADSVSKEQATERMRASQEVIEMPFFAMSNYPGYQVAHVGRFLVKLQLRCPLV